MTGRPLPSDRHSVTNRGRSAEQAGVDASTPTDHGLVIPVRPARRRAAEAGQSPLRSISSIL
jgi:hypothetical protein